MIRMHNIYPCKNGKDFLDFLELDATMCFWKATLLHLNQNAIIVITPCVTRNLFVLVVLVLRYKLKIMINFWVFIVRNKTVMTKIYPLSINLKRKTIQKWYRPYQIITIKKIYVPNLYYLWNMNNTDNENLKAVYKSTRLIYLYDVFAPLVSSMPSVICRMWSTGTGLPSGPTVAGWINPPFISWSIMFTSFIASYSFCSSVIPSRGFLRSSSMQPVIGLTLNRRLYPWLSKNYFY